MGVKKRCTVIDELGMPQNRNLLHGNDFLKGMTVALAVPRSPTLQGARLEQAASRFTCSLRADRYIHTNRVPR
jgi:hypothetical protein